MWTWTWRRQGSSFKKLKLWNWFRRCSRRIHFFAWSKRIYGWVEDQKSKRSSHNVLEKFACPQLLQHRQFWQQFYQIKAIFSAQQQWNHWASYQRSLKNGRRLRRNINPKTTSGHSQRSHYTRLPKTGIFTDWRGCLGHQRGHWCCQTQYQVCASACDRNRRWSFERFGWGMREER